MKAKLEIEARIEDIKDLIDAPCRAQEYLARAVKAEKDLSDYKQLLKDFFEAIQDSDGLWFSACAGEWKVSPHTDKDLDHVITLVVGEWRAKQCAKEK
jgi:hypothetical protein